MIKTYLQAQIMQNNPILIMDLHNEDTDQAMTFAFPGGKQVNLQEILTKQAEMLNRLEIRS